MLKEIAVNKNISEYYKKAQDASSMFLCDIENFKQKFKSMEFLTMCALQQIYFKKNVFKIYYYKFLA